MVPILLKKAMLISYILYLTGLLYLKCMKLECFFSIVGGRVAWEGGNRLKTSHVAE
jgi:hypothetical protein